MAIAVYDVLVYATAVFGLLANFSVLVIVACSEKMRRSAMNLLVANLALTDFLLLLLTEVPASTVSLMHITVEHLLGVADSHCLLTKFFPEVCWTSTVTTFMAIALERWLP